MYTLRKHGPAPYHLAVVHGGPGAAGSTTHLAKHLSRRHGVLEPIQTATSIRGQITELHETLSSEAAVPCTVIGWSWGAMLGFMLAARHPGCVRKLIMIGSGPFAEEYAPVTLATRLSRLSPELQAEAQTVMEQLKQGQPGEENDALLSRMAELFTGCDDYDPLPVDNEPIDYQSAVHHLVWDEAKKMRSRGELLSLAHYIQCPVVAIHGDHDSHPVDGVSDPLTGNVRDFRLVRLEKCGHRPWVERQAMDLFYHVLSEEID